MPTGWIKIIGKRFSPVETDNPQNIMKEAESQAIKKMGESQVRK